MMMIPLQYDPSCGDEDVNEKCYYRSFCPALATALRQEAYEPACFGSTDEFCAACTNALLKADARDLLDLDKLVPFLMHDYPLLY